MKSTWQELPTSARDDIRFFNLILESHNWADDLLTEHRLDRGEAVYPHATRSGSNQHCSLQTSLRTQVGMLSLNLIPHEAEKPQLSLHLLYKSNPIKLLEEIVKAQPWLQPGLYFRFALQITSLCHDVLVELPNQALKTFSSEDIQE